MPLTMKIALRAGLLLVAILCALAGDLSAAYAQSSSCSGLFNTLRTLERNRDFRNYQARADELRSVQENEQQAESQYIRGGCNDDAKAKRPLSRECRALARAITEGRRNVEILTQSVSTGDAVAQQREAVLQEIARFGCGNGSNSSATFSNDDPTADPIRRNIFEQLFGSGSEGQIIGDEFSGFEGYQTVRTVCVRTCDGYYWPVSYSTLPEYVGNDAQQCQAQCPGTPVDLYYYDNPGQEAEQMISVNGAPYSSLPNAFRYRREFDATCTCKAPVTYGSINITPAAAGGQSRAVIQFGQLNFPLPLRDPRRQQQVITAAPSEVAEYVSVPLPRPRPSAPGEAPLPAPVAADNRTRTIKFGDKSVRIVGPDTPYAPEAPAGT